MSTLGYIVKRQYIEKENMKKNNSMDTLSNKLGRLHMK